MENTNVMLSRGKCTRVNIFTVLPEHTAAVLSRFRNRERRYRIGEGEGREEGERGGTFRELSREFATLVSPRHRMIKTHCTPCSERAIRNVKYRSASDLFRLVSYEERCAMLSHSAEN